jgi:hypothetical protein
LKLPFPDVAVCDVTTNQEPLPDAVHWHADTVVTATVPNPPLDGKVALGGFRVMLHPITVVASITVASAEPPPETVTWFTTKAGAVGETFIVTVIAG